MAEYREGMSSVKKLIILLVVLAVLIGAFFGVKAWNTHEEEEEKGTVVFSFEPSDAAAFRYTLEGAEYSFVRGEDGNWSYEQDPSLVLDQGAVDAMLEASSKVYAQTIVSETPDNLEEYGLEKPVFTLDVTLKDKQEIGIYEGSVNSMNGVTYACMKGDGRIAALQPAVSSSFRAVNELLEQNDELSE